MANEIRKFRSFAACLILAKSINIFLGGKGVGVTAFEGRNRNTKF